MTANPAWLEAVRRAAARQLEGFGGPWLLGGDVVLGPGKLSLLVTTRHDAGPAHVDLGIGLDRERADAPVLWDCVSGVGETLDAQAAFACSIWAQTTVPCIFELLTRDGRYADHAHGADGLGIEGWHSLHGPILGYGREDASSLQRWCLDHPIFPALSGVLGARLEGDGPHGVKVLLGAFDGAPVAEVRIDGDGDAACSAALLDLPWPRDASCVVRFFAVFAHRLAA